MNSLFKALNDETRRQIVELLKEKDMNAGEIADRFNISKPSISHHLDILKRADLITSEKKGQFVEYSLNTSILEVVKIAHEQNIRVVPLVGPSSILLAMMSSCNFILCVLIIQSLFIIYSRLVQGR